MYTTVSAHFENVFLTPRIEPRPAFAREASVCSRYWILFWGREGLTELLGVALKSLTSLCSPWTWVPFLSFSLQLATTTENILLQGVTTNPLISFLLLDTQMVLSLFCFAFTINTIDRFCSTHIVIFPTAGFHTVDSKKRSFWVKERYVFRLFWGGCKIARLLGAGLAFWIGKITYYNERPS